MALTIVRNDIVSILSFQSFTDFSTIEFSCLPDKLHITLANLV